MIIVTFFAGQILFYLNFTANQHYYIMKYMRKKKKDVLIGFTNLSKSIELD